MPRRDSGVPACYARSVGARQSSEAVDQKPGEDAVGEEERPHSAVTLLAILVTLVLAVFTFLVSGALAVLVDPEIEGAARLLAGRASGASRNE